MQHKLYGIILILIATFLFAVLDTCSKYLTAFFAVPLIVWARYFVHLVFMLVGIAPGMGREIVVTKRPWLMIFRGLLLVCSSLLVVLAFRTLPLAETTALVFSTPLLVALLAGPLLGEKVPLKSWLATISGFGAAGHRDTMLLIYIHMKTFVSVNRLHICSHIAQIESRRNLDMRSKAQKTPTTAID